MEPDDLHYGTDVFVADTARVIGRVSLGDQVSVWYGAVVRADLAPIRIGRGSNVQDNAVIHVSQDIPVEIGSYVTIGHAAVVHAAQVGDYSLIGMNATVLDDAEIGQYCIVGAGSLIPPRSRIPDFSLVMGLPAKIVKTLTPEMMEANRQNAEEYIHLAQKYLKQFSRNSV